MEESSRLRQLARWNLSATVRFLLLLILTLLPGPAEAETYRWVDEHGRVHFTQGLESIPERYRAQARLLDLGPIPPSPAPGYKLYSPPIASEPRLPPAPLWATKWEPTGALPEITQVSFPPGSHILITAKINGQGPVKLLLDTGAPQTYISAQAVRTLGISAPNYPCRPCEIKTIRGLLKLDGVQILSLRVEEAEMTGPVFIESDDSKRSMGAVGLLGRNFLDNFRVTVDSRQRVVTLVPTTTSNPDNRESRSDAADVSRIPFPPGPYILLSGTINGGGPITFNLDTGASNTWLSAKALRSLGISTENAESRTLEGLSGKIPVVFVEVASVEVGGAKVGPLRIAAFIEMDTVLGGGAADGLLGLDFLKNFNVTIDPSERVVTLEGPGNLQDFTVETQRSEPIGIREGRGNPQEFAVETDPRQPIVIREERRLQGPGAMPSQRGRWLWAGLAALAVLGLCALQIVRCRKAESPKSPNRLLVHHPEMSGPEREEGPLP